ncbi:MAG: hypothetical protein FJ335_11725 [Sphingomonadales bacterium]|nr:hypothetical protein [Sphingomonadales bacterium]
MGHDRPLDAGAADRDAVATALIGHGAAHDLTRLGRTLRHRLDRLALDVRLGGEVPLRLDLVGDMDRAATDQGTTGRKGAEFR